MTYPRIRATQNLDKNLSWAGPTAVLVAGDQVPVLGVAITAKIIIFAPSLELVEVK